MKTLLTIALTPAVAGFLALTAQDPKDGRVQELTPLPTPQQPVDANQDSAVPFDAGALKQGLRAPSLEERERSYDDLLRAARRDRAAMQTLRDWAADASDLELAWTAKLALRELSLRRDPFGGTADPFDALRGGDGLRFHFGADPFSGAFPDAARAIEDAQREIERLMQGMGGATPFPGTPPAGTSQSQSFELESGPDGVKVRVHEDVDGQQETKTYEAESLEELLDTYPELRGRIQLSPGLPGDAHERLEDMLGRLRASPFGAVPPPLNLAPGSQVPTDRLGVHVCEPGTFDAPEGIEAGFGLLVEQALPGTIAAELGLQQGDVLIELSGRKLASAEDVRAALAARGPEEPIVLKIVDSFGQARTLTWKPADAAQPGTDPAAPQPLRRF